MYGPGDWVPFGVHCLREGRLDSRAVSSACGKRLDDVVVGTRMANDAFTTVIIIGA